MSMLDLILVTSIPPSNVMPWPDSIGSMVTQSFSQQVQMNMVLRFKRKPSKNVKTRIPFALITQTFSKPFFPRLQSPTIVSLEPPIKIIFMQFKPFGGVLIPIIAFLKASIQVITV